jgi:hypothetical protein
VNGRINHKANEPLFQQQCLARYIQNLPGSLRLRFVERLEKRHGHEYVDNLRRIHKEAGE